MDALIFDIDGTLVDSVDLHAKAWQEAFEKFGKIVPFETIRSQIGKGADQLLPAFFSPEEIDGFGKDLIAFRGNLYRRKYLPLVKPFPKVRALFERILRRGKKRIVLASSAPAEEIDACKRIAGIDDLIDGATVSADDAEHSKPAPDIIAAALALLKNIEREEVLVVGDSPYDAMAAKRAGLRSVGLLCGGSPEEELRRAGCIALYQDPADLLEHYDELGLL